uniref:Uncharacterized protein n=1 Tax=Anguilla anguilla TaxID=7936 RepID=A0A0E9Q454_ANGAN
MIIVITAFWFINWKGLWFVFIINIIHMLIFMKYVRNFRFPNCATLVTPLSAAVRVEPYLSLTETSSL